MTSTRGFYGGYQLTRPAAEITVGEILRHVHKEMAEAECLACISVGNCPFAGGCAFSSLWQRVKTAVFKVYDDTTLQDLLDDKEAAKVLDPRCAV